MNKKVYVGILAVILLVNITALGITLSNRHSVEMSSSGVEFILDYSELMEMVEESEENLEFWLEKFKSYGITSVAIIEETVHSLAESIDRDLFFMPFENWYATAMSRDIELNDQIEALNLDSFDMLIVTKDETLHEWVTDRYIRDYADHFITAFEHNNQFFLILNGDREQAIYLRDGVAVDREKDFNKNVERIYSSKLLTVGLGLDEEKVKSIQGSGLEVLPRIIPNRDQPLDSIRSYEREVEKYNLNPNLMLFAGKEVLGFPGELGTLAEYLKEHRMSVGLIETDVQRQHLKMAGLDTLIELMNKEQLVRVFTMWPYIQERYGYYNYEGPEEITNTFYRAITERNIRVVYFRPFLYENRYVTEEWAYEKMFQDLNNRLAKHQLEIGVHIPFEPITTPFFLQVLISIGIVMAGIILLNAFYPLYKWVNLILIAIGAVGVTGSLYVAPNMARTLISLAISVIFPSLSIAYLLYQLQNQKEKKPSLGRILFRSAYLVVLVTGISLLGGLYLTGILTDIDYLLELKIFRGVKVSQLIPLAIVGLLALKAYSQQTAKGFKSMANQYYNMFNKFFNSNVKIKYVVYTGVVLVIGYIYLARTGHESNVQPLNIEILARNFLENTLMSRPRFKEFSIAIPALMLAVYASYKFHYAFAVVLVFIATIGQTSVLNTFAHQRTPFYLSVIRTFYGNLLGIVIGSIGVVCIHLIYEKIFIRYRRNKKGTIEV